MCSSLQRLFSDSVFSKLRLRLSLRRLYGCCKARWTRPIMRTVTQPIQPECKRSLRHRTAKALTEAIHTASSVPAHPNACWKTYSKSDTEFYLLRFVWFYSSIPTRQYWYIYILYIYVEIYRDMVWHAWYRLITPSSSSRTLPHKYKHSSGCGSQIFIGLLTLTHLLHSSFWCQEEAFLLSPMKIFWLNGENEAQEATLQHPWRATWMSGTKLPGLRCRTYQLQSDASFGLCWILNTALTLEIHPMRGWQLSRNVLRSFSMCRVCFGACSSSPANGAQGTEGRGWTSPIWIYSDDAQIVKVYERLRNYPPTEVTLNPRHLEHPGTMSRSW